MCSAILQRVDLLILRNRFIQVANRPDMFIAVMSGHRFADVQESCFEAWKRSHMVCAALLCARFADAQESRIQVC